MLLLLINIKAFYHFFDLFFRHIEPVGLLRDSIIEELAFIMINELRLFEVLFELLKVVVVEIFELATTCNEG